MNKQRIALLGASIAISSSLTACYVVPHQPGQVQLAQVQLSSVPPAPLRFTARLYPTNAAATELGSATGFVTNELNGRGYFSVLLGNEAFKGEATRSVTNSSTGIANATGHQGHYLNCKYQMSSAVLGSGVCTHSGGGTFSLHIGD